MVQGSLEVITRIQESTGNDTDEQGAVNFLGDQCQRDGDDRRYQ